jgi:ABC-type sugar transport system substrate-binding protein
LFSITALAVLVALLLAGCVTPVPTAAPAAEPQAAAPEAAAPAGEPYTIGIVLKSFANPFWMMARTAAEAAAAEQGVEVVILGITEEGDYAGQVTHIEDLVTRQVDLIVVVPAESKALVPAVEAAVAAGIPVINLDSPIDTDQVVAFIGSDNVEGGRMAGEFIAEQLGGEGKVAVIRGRLGNPVETQRNDGFKEAIANYPGIEIVAEGVGNWEAEEGAKVMEDFLTAHPEIQAVFAEADRMALGAASAAAAANRSDIIIVGLDGIKEALQAVKDGTLAADVAQRPDLMGQYAVEKGLEFLQTGTIEPNVITPMTLAVPDNVDPLIEAWNAVEQQ